MVKIVIMWPISPDENNNIGLVYIFLNTTLNRWPEFADVVTNLLTELIIYAHAKNCHVGARNVSLV